MSRLSALIPFAVVASLAACASAGTSSGTSSGTASGTRSSPDHITTAEIQSSGASNAFDLINRLRPNWLRPPSMGSLSPLPTDPTRTSSARTQLIVVYLDGHRLGDIQSLRSLSLSGLQSFEWLDATRAATVLNEVGSDPIAGAIVIKSR